MRFLRPRRARDMRLIAGKVMMDRNCPEDLRDTASSGYAESKALIERWHGKGRLQYAITPRFAPPPRLNSLAAAGRLAREAPRRLRPHAHRRKTRKKWLGRGALPGTSEATSMFTTTRPVTPALSLAHGILAR